MSNLSRKEREFARREQDILAAAIELFDRSDWEQVTVEQIAKRAEIGKGTVYKHFSCKEEIYAHIALDFSDRLLVVFKEIDQRQPVDAILREVIRVSFQLFLSNPPLARVSYYCKRGDFRERLNEKLRQAFDAMDQAFEEFIAGIMEAGIAQGLIPQRPLEHLVIGLEATFDGAMAMIWNGEVSLYGEMEQAEFVNVISEYMVAGVMALKSVPGE